MVPSSVMSTDKNIEKHLILHFFIFLPKRQIALKTLLNGIYIDNFSHNNL